MLQGFNNLQYVVRKVVFTVAKFSAMTIAFPLMQMCNACATRQLWIDNWTLAHNSTLCIYNGALNRQLVQRPSEGLWNGCIRLSILEFLVTFTFCGKSLGNLELTYRNEIWHTHTSIYVECNYLLGIVISYKRIYEITRVLIQHIAKKQKEKSWLL